ncbi:vomeronasal type-1 receptor 4-like [Ochotona princeps]|uniref:vomeronasal type-1 receptor 4-like n=1 Tax=Ochotona princeps TaxID=9978 RepID=UPI0027154541|nr:vomeronasal type-1 receptor 4-like [Ochotona princeps]
MLPRDIAFGVFLLVQIGVGVVGNSFLFMLYTYIFFTQPHLKKTIDVIFIHLTSVNILTITFRVVPDITSSFGVRHLLDTVGCKAVLCLYRVTRGVSICTTSLLSVFQAITVSPGHSKWAWLKPKLPSWILPSFLCFWIANMVFWIYVNDSVTANLNVTVVGRGFVHAYCHNRQAEGHRSVSLFVVMVIHDVLFVTLMVRSSLYMVCILYRHRRRAWHIHSRSLSSQTSPESKATHTVLLLVFCFMFFYFSNNVATFYLFYRPEKNPEMEKITGIIASCYPTICPFVLMTNNKMISSLLPPMQR